MWRLPHNPIINGAHPLADGLEVFLVADQYPDFENPAGPTTFSGTVVNSEDENAAYIRPDSTLSASPAISAANGLTINTFCDFSTVPETPDGGFAIHPSGAYYNLLLRNSSNLQLASFNGGYINFSPTLWPTTPQWLTLGYDSSGAVAYQDGVQTASHATDMTVATTIDSWIGETTARQWSPTACLFVWTRRLDDDELAEINVNPFSPFGIPLVVGAYHDLDDFIAAAAGGGTILPFMMAYHGG